MTTPNPHTPHANTANRFSASARAATRDPALQVAVTQATTTAYTKRITAMYAAGHDHGEALRMQAAEAKRRALEKLPELLEQLEANMQANGITVLWAADAAEAREHVLHIAAEHGTQHVIKAKSMISEEIELNAALQNRNIDVVETDLGEFIIQLAGEPPSHIVTPVIHKSKAAIRDLFVRELGMTPTDDAQAMTHFAREVLREKFLAGDMGISGGNFLIAETGSLALVTNEGNGRMATTLPPVHVALVGIEKIVETFDDYITLTQVLTRSATGQAMSVYTHLINGPRRADDPDGPEHVYVILVDNGRSRVYNSSYAEVLACIRCGSCINACPVYKAVGGHAYGWVYPGPIGAVITPLLTGLENASPLPHASSLCGECKAVCPVDIDLPGLLLDLRYDLVEAGHTPLLWRAGLRGWSWMFRSPRLYTLAGRLARWGARLIPRQRKIPLGPLGAWTQSRDVPPLAPQSFREQWQADQRDQKGSNS